MDLAESDVIWWSLLTGEVRKNSANLADNIRASPFNKDL
jgi:hypothetical protein